MNNAFPRALMLCACLCLSIQFGFATSGDKSDSTPSKKEVIIVSMTADINDQIIGLAQYVHDLHIDKNDGEILIKTYLKDQLDQSATIDLLVTTMKNLGVEDAKIKVSNEELTLDEAYFSLSVSSGPAVQ